MSTAREAAQMPSLWFNDFDIPIVHRWLLDPRTDGESQRSFYSSVDALEKHADLTGEVVVFDHPATKMISAASGHVVRPTALPVVAHYLIHGGDSDGAR